MTNLILAMFKSDGTRRDFPLVRDRIIIGRKVNCDLRIPLTSVSRQHCEITVDHGTVHIKDLGSSNGTYHNSVRVQEANLSAGDELSIGPVVFTLIVDGQPAEITPVRTIVKNEESDFSSTAKTITSPQPATIATDDLEMPEIIEDDEDMIPTIELEDEDPIAALESLAGSDNDDSDEFDDIDFFLDDDDDD